MSLSEEAGVISPAVSATFLLLPFTISGALVATCGEGGDAPVSKMRAASFATAVNLRVGDVPRLATFVSGFETTVGPPFGGCATQVPASDDLVGVSSPWFRRSRGQRRGGVGGSPRPPVEGVHSDVYVMRKPGSASRNVAAGRSAGAARCVERLSESEASGRIVGREPYKSEIRALSLRFPLPGVAGYALQVRGTLAATLFHQRKRPAFYEDTFGFAIGPAEIVLHTTGIARAFPSAVEQRLLALLYDRAKAHAIS